MSEPIEITERYWSPRQVADALNVEERTIRRWCNAGLMRHVRMSRLIRISDSDLSQFLARIRREADAVRAGGEPGEFAKQAAALSRDPRVEA